MTASTGLARPAGFPERVQVVEVGTRDGFQAEAEWIPTETKIDILNDLIDAGLPQFEATAFVSPRAVPQLRDAAEVMAGVKRIGGAKLTALVPNPKGAEAAAAARVDAMVVFVSASESHNLKNLNRSRADTLEGFKEVCRIAEAAGIPVEGAIATSFGCPFEGNVSLDAVVEIARTYRDLGLKRVALGDTTGMATPPLVTALCRRLREELPDVRLALHFHNTRGIGLVNVHAGLAEGISSFESSIGGLGGCPFAPGATGNICTEDLVYLLHECGIETGIDLDKLCAVAQRVEKLVGRQLPGQVMKAGPRLRTSSMDAVATACG
ncbi:MAG TPA: hydroxymethylglutaryl-CoA lyase [Kiloniellales bacterium]|nr:hydroxymethylglutaryl-CoA lyase [Kiloniellales bacterium]